MKRYLSRDPIAADRRDERVTVDGQAQVSTLRKE